MAPETPEDVRRRAAHARRLAKGTLDQKAVQSLTDLAAELQKRAVTLEKSAAKAATHAAIAQQTAAEMRETSRQMQQRSRKSAKPRKPE
jgi:hypothetical protein